MLPAENDEMFEKAYMIENAKLISWSKNHSVVMDAITTHSVSAPRPYTVLPKSNVPNDFIHPPRAFKL